MTTLSIKRSLDYQKQKGTWHHKTLTQYINLILIDRLPDKGLMALSAQNRLNRALLILVVLFTVLPSWCYNN